MKKGSMQAKEKKRIIGWVALALFCAPVFGAEETPFYKPKKTIQVAPVADPSAMRLDALEFTGMIAFAGETTFSLYDPKTKQSVWVPLEGSEDGVSIDDFDEEGGTITVSLGGRSREIVINENEIVTLKRAAPPKVSPRRPAVASNPAALKAKKVVRQKNPETLKKEEEARMFVSNLLADSMKQRERYRREREERIANAKKGASRR